MSFLQNRKKRETEILTFCVITAKKITQMSFLQNRKKRETEILTFCVITFEPIKC
jgi:hypothetical protein